MGVLIELAHLPVAQPAFRLQFGSLSLAIYFHVKAPCGSFKGGVLESASTSSICVVSVHISVHEPKPALTAAAFSQEIRHLAMESKLRC